MVFLISYRKKFNSEKLQLKLRKTFFAEYQGKPSVNEVKTLVQRISQGDCAEETVDFHECVGFEAEELRRSGVPVHHLEAVSASAEEREMVGARKR